MSSGYLTSTDMVIIERLLAEVREPSENRSFEKETARALMLIRAAEQGVTSEHDLRLLLIKHEALHRITDQAYATWDNEGGAAERAVR